MQKDKPALYSKEEYCFNCGASNATDSAIVTVAYGRGSRTFIKEGRPHCADCANVETSVYYIGVIIILAIAAIVLIAFAGGEWSYF